MADDPWRLNSPHVHDSRCLAYGHLGTASYGQDKRWNFLRQPIQSPLARDTNQRVTNHTSEPHGTLYFPKLIHGPASVPPKVDESNAVLSLTALPPSQLKIHHLSKRAPEIASAAAVILQQLASSPSTSNASSAHPSFDREILATGHIAAFGDHRIDRAIPPIPIIARTSPENPAETILLLLNRQTISAEDATVSDCIIPSASPDELLRWTNSADPVLQIAFAADAANGPPGMLAIRSQFSTTILRPVIHLDAPTSVSYLKQHVEVVIPCTHTGGASHAHAAINPTNPEQIAIIDAQGNWSVWRTRSVYKVSSKITSRAQLLGQGSLRADFREKYTSKRSRYADGWHTVCWLTESLLLISNRKFAYTYDSNGSVAGFVNLKVDGKSSRESVLNIRAVSSSPGECFVLTTSHLIWMALEEGYDAMRRNQSVLRRIASWAHGRSHHDLSPRLHTLEHSEGTFVFISSADGQIVTMHHAIRRSKFTEQQYALVDPVPLKLNQPITADLHLRIESIKWMEHERHADSQIVPFFKLFLSNTRDAIFEAVYKMSGVHPGDNDLQCYHAIRLPPLSTRLHKSAKVVEDNDLNDFVMDDELTNWCSARQASTEIGVSVRNEQGAVACDLRSIYNEIMDSRTLSSTSDAVSLRETLKTLDTKLVALDVSQLGMDLILAHTDLAEIEEDSSLADAWLEYLTQGIHTGAKFEIARFDGRSLLDIYHSMLEGWISSLSPEVPDRIRIYKERLLRQIALDIFMSNIAILKVQSEKDVAIANDRVPTSPTLPPLDDSTQSQILPNSRSPLDPDCETWTLQKYTTFSNPLPPMSTEKSIARLLAHLPTSIDIDPATYDYKTIQSSLFAQDAEATLASMHEKSRRRVTNAAAARKRRLDRQQDIRNEASQQLSSVPNIMTSSQMPIRGIKSSQTRPVQGSSQRSLGSNLPEISLTQPERGIHGSRPQGKKDKSKGRSNRIPGFR